MSIEGSLSLNINLCTFINCSCSNNGGAIYFYCSSNFFIKNSCGNNCYSSTNHVWAQFGYFRTGDNINYNLIFEQLSISKCPNHGIGYGSLYLYSGNQSINSLNCSKNYILHTSGFISNYCNRLNCQFSTFFNNTATLAICLDYRFGSNDRISKYLNIILNNSPSHWGVIYSEYSIISLLNCIFQQNQNILFSNDQGTIKIENCLINHISNSLSNGILQLINSTNSNIFYQTLNLQHFITYFCDSETIIKSFSINSKFKILFIIKILFILK